MKAYEKDYEETIAALEAALHKRDDIDSRISTLQQRVHALETLIRADYPDKGKLVLRSDTTPASAMVNVVTPEITELVRRLLAYVRKPLTSGEIYERLQQDGAGLNPKANPWALIHGICRRLVDQGFAQEEDKDGRKAWVLASK